MTRPLNITRILSTSMNDDPYITVIYETSEGATRTLHLEPRAAFNLVEALNRWVHPEGEWHADFRHALTKGKP